MSEINSTEKMIIEKDCTSFGKQLIIEKWAVPDGGYPSDVEKVSDISKVKLQKNQVFIL
mgnify:CR=1 FL=1